MPLPSIVGLLVDWKVKIYPSYNRTESLKASSALNIGTVAKARAQSKKEQAKAFSKNQSQEKKLTEY